MSIKGTNGKNTLTGSIYKDDIYGLYGNDLIKAGAGNDIIYGDDEQASPSDGDDTLYGESGDDTFYGGRGADKIFGGLGSDKVNLASVSTVYSGSYLDGKGDVIDGGVGADTVVIDYHDYTTALTLTIRDWVSSQTLTGGISVINVEVFQIHGTRFGDKITGGNSIDNLFGLEGKDTLNGGGGKDTLDGGEDKDTLSGGSQDDRLYGGSGDDILYGGSGNDILRGGNGDDDEQGSDEKDGTYGANKLYGDAGNDVLYNDGGNDLLEGGTGNDEYRHWMGYGKATIVDASGKDRLVLEDFTGNFTAKSADVTTTLSDGTTFKGIENFTITAKSDAGRSYTFGSGADILFAGDGNDTIKGGDGNDTLYAGDGKDNVSGGAGNDSVFLGYGKGETADGGSGTDKVDVSRGYIGDVKGLTFSVSGNTAKLSDGTQLKNFERYSVLFGDGNDVVKSVGSALSVEFDGGGGNDTLLGGAGDDILKGGGGSDTINGGAGNDTIQDNFNYSYTKNTINAGSGNDTVYVSETAGAPADFTVDLGTGNDRLDQFGYVKGKLFVDGGTGTDLVSLDLRTTAQNLTFVLTASAKFTNVSVTLKNIERVDIIGGAGNDTFTGGKLADTLNGDAGEDTIHGGDGNDTITGNSFLSEYSFIDYYFGGESDQDGSRDKLYGEGGNDEVGIASGDIADGGTGVDTLYVDFMAKTSNVSFTFTTGKVKLDSTTTVDKFEVLSYLGGSGKDAVTGSSRGDTLDGNNGNDTLKGGSGNDALLDGEGNDKLYGDAGNDTFTRSGLFVTDDFDSGAGTDVFDGGAGTDTLDFFSPVYNIGPVIIDLAHQTNNAGAAEGLTVKNMENINGAELDDDIRGDSKANVFNGREGGDFLSGGSGNDTLNGGGGGDLLTGGAGDDKFVFTADSRSHSILVPDPDNGGFSYIWVYSTGDDDVITDFTRGEDKLVIDAKAFGIKDQKITLVSGTDPKATTDKPTLLFETDTGRVWFDADGKSGTLAPELIATLQNVTKLTTGDFDFL